MPEELNSQETEWTNFTIEGFVIKNADRSEIFRVTPDQRVIIPGDLYEAAKDFWELVQQLAPEGWSLEKEVNDA